jgi:hypothetical protein
LLSLSFPSLSYLPLSLSLSLPFFVSGRSLVGGLFHADSLYDCGDLKKGDIFDGAKCVASSGRRGKKLDSTMGIGLTDCSDMKFLGSETERQILRLREVGREQGLKKWINIKGDGRERKIDRVRKLPELVKLKDDASVMVNNIDKVTVIDNVSSVKIRHGRWQASYLLSLQLFGGWVVLQQYITYIVLVPSINAIN